MKHGPAMRAGRLQASMITGSDIACPPFKFSQSSQFEL